MGERTLVIGDLPVREAPRTLMVAWGDWVGRAAALFLLAFGAAAALRRFGAAVEPAAAGAPAALPACVAVLPPAARIAAGALRVFSRGSLLWMAAAVALDAAALQSRTLAQIRLFVACFLAPEGAAWCVLLAFGARAAIEDGALVLTRSRRRLALPLRDIAAVEPWRVPIPGSGAALRLVSGARWRYGLAHRDPAGLARALAAAAVDGAPASVAPAPVSRATLYAQVRGAIARGRLDRPVAKFVLFPIALAIPAFRLHQHIAYGSTFGEYYSFGATAYLTTFALWWAAWAIGVVLCAATLRAAIEAGTLAGVWLRPAGAIDARRWLERGGLAALYLGLPAWLLFKLLAG
jgi:apolipoprotein N-acyltransferase